MQGLTRKIFVSYSRTDLSKVKPLVRLLRASDVDVFIDVEDIGYGERWESVIEDGVRNAERFLIFWSKSAAKSDYVRREYLAALQTPRIVIIPVSLDGTPLPSELAQFQALTELQPLLDKAKGTFTSYRIAVVSLLMILILGGVAQFWLLRASSNTAYRDRVADLTEPKIIARGPGAPSPSPTVRDDYTSAQIPSVEHAPKPRHASIPKPYSIPKHYPKPNPSPIPSPSPFNSNKPAPTPSKEPEKISQVQPPAQQEMRRVPQTENDNESYLPYLTIALFCTALFGLLIMIYQLRASRKRLARSINEIIFNKPNVGDTTE